MTPQKTLPRWPLDRWSTAVERLLEANRERIVDIGSFCMALNNAALIEFHRGDFTEAQRLCRLQVERLLCCSRVDADHRARYVLQPIINLFRLERHVDAEGSARSFDALQSAMRTDDEPGVQDDLLRAALELSRRYCRDDLRALAWIDSVCCREALAALLRAGSWSELRRRLSAAHVDAKGSGAVRPAVQMVEDEARLLLGIHDGSVRELGDAERFAHVPLVIALAQVAQVSGANDAGELDDILVLAVVELLEHSSLTRSAGEILYFLMCALVERRKDTALLDEAIAWAQRLQDEVLEFQLAARSSCRAQLERRREIASQTQYWLLRRESPAQLGRCPYPKHQFTRHLVDVV